MRTSLAVVIALFSAPLFTGCPAPTPAAPASPTAPPPARANGTNGCAPRVGTAPSFEIAVLGSGGPGGFGRAASGYVVSVDGAARVLVDVGPGAFVRLGEMGFELDRLDTVLLTHLHVDHSGDLPGFVKSRDVSNDEPLVFRIFGPQGRGDYPSTTTFVDRIFGARGAFAYLPRFRNPIRFDVKDLPIAAGGPVQQLVRDKDLRVTSIAVDHDDVPAAAYRIERDGHAVVVTGDLASKNDDVARLAEGADLLVYDAAVVDPPGSAEKLYDLHTPPKRIGEIAAKAHVKALVLSHITPAVENAPDAVLRSVHASYTGSTRFATDCLRVDLTK